jgi:hypothetical protein
MRNFAVIRYFWPFDRSCVLILGCLLCLLLGIVGGIVRRHHPPLEGIVRAVTMALILLMPPRLFHVYVELFEHAVWLPIIVNKAKPARQQIANLNQTGSLCLCMPGHRLLCCAVDRWRPYNLKS